MFSEGGSIYVFIYWVSSGFVHMELIVGHAPVDPGLQAGKTFDVRYIPCLLSYCMHHLHKEECINYLIKA